MRQAITALVIAATLTGCALFTPPPRVWEIADDDLRAIERSLLVAYGVQKGRVGLLCQAMQGSEVCASSLAFLGQLEAAYQATTKALKPGGGPLPPGTLNGILDLILKAAPLVGGLAI